MVRRVLFVGILLYGMAIFPSPAETFKARVLKTGSVVSLEINTPRFINPELLKILKAGVSISAVFEIRIFRKNPLSLYIFPYKSYVFRKSIDHNVQNDIYSLNLLGSIRRSNDLDGSLEDLYRNEILQLKGFVPVGAATGYLLRIRFRMEELKLYPPLSLVVNMVDAYRYSTEWMELEMEQVNEKVE